MKALTKTHIARSLQVGLFRDGKGGPALVQFVQQPDRVAAQLVSCLTPGMAWAMALRVARLAVRGAWLNFRASLKRPR